MDERTERLLQKAETAIDQNNTDQAEAYAMLAARNAYPRRREAREMNRALETNPETP